MTPAPSAMVIGGGIAGPVAAMALQKAGIEATVYETYDSGADGIGGALSIAPNGLNALSVIGADDVVRRVGTPMTAMIMQSWTGKRLAEFGSPPGLPPMQLVWRADLYRALYDEAANPIARVLRDMLMPVAVKLAKPEKWAWQFDYRIDWDARVAGGERFDPTRP